MSKYLEWRNTPTNYEYVFQFNAEELLLLTKLIGQHKASVRKTEAFGRAASLSKTLNTAMNVARPLEAKRKKGREALSNQQEPRSAEAPDATPNNQGVDHHE